MSNSHPTISQIVTFHSEGVLAHFSLSGLIRVREYAQANKIPLEFVLVLDNADELTSSIVKNHPLVGAGDQVIEVEHADPSLSRNSGVNAARGDYVGMMDGDDYYSANWPVVALEVARKAKVPIVVHPELLITFGSICAVTHVIDMDKDDFSSAICVTNHPWIACSFGVKEIYAKHPYHPANVIDSGFGYEDWHWNVDLLAHGVRHICAPKTAQFYRRAAQSRFTIDATSGAIIRPTAFFDQVDIWESINSALIL